MYGTSSNPLKADILIENPIDQPGDSVSSISWSPNNKNRLFICSSWDSNVRLYKLHDSALERKITLETIYDLEDPALCTDWKEDSSIVFAGCINNKIIGFDLNTQQDLFVGKHDIAVCGIHWISHLNALITLSYNSKIKLWDLRQVEPIKTLQLSYRVTCSDYNSGLLAVGLSQSKVTVLDTRDVKKIRNPICVESMLGPDTIIDCIAVSPGGKFVATGGNDGRVNISNYGGKSKESGKKQIMSCLLTFKAYIVKFGDNEPSILYPVNSVGFNPRSPNFLFTAGGNGVLSFWDFDSKSAITSHGQGDVPITRAKLSPDGVYIAYAQGYDWERGIYGYQSYTPKVIVYHIQQNELVYQKSK